jgi:hypothetical protein
MHLNPQTSKSKQLNLIIELITIHAEVLECIGFRHQQLLNYGPHFLE